MARVDKGSLPERINYTLSRPHSQPEHGFPSDHSLVIRGPERQKMNADELSRALNHEERLRAVEMGHSRHEATCDERYKNIEGSFTKVLANQNTMFYMIIATMLGMFGKDIALQIIFKYFGK